MFVRRHRTVKVVYNQFVRPAEKKRLRATKFLWPR